MNVPESLVRNTSCLLSITEYGTWTTTWINYDLELYISSPKYVDSGSDSRTSGVWNHVLRYVTSGDLLSIVEQYSWIISLLKSSVYLEKLPCARVDAQKKLASDGSLELVSTLNLTKRLASEDQAQFTTEA